MMLDQLQLNKQWLDFSPIACSLQPCCTVFNSDGYWYRAEVVGTPSVDIAEVLYVDYGNVGRVSLA